jgi:hypothetical protein
MRIFVVFGIAAVATSAALGAEVQPTIPVKFVIDCSRVKDVATRQLCEPLIANQARKVFPAYRKITGIKLEQRCPILTYTIYESNFPHPRGGGVSYNCQIDYMAREAFLLSANSKIGPYELHEILHHYQFTSKELSGLSGTHVLFTPSIVEAEAEVGDNELHDKSLARIKIESAQLRANLESGKVKPTDRCKVARAIVEEELYLASNQNIYQFYGRLASVVPKDAADSERRYDSMLNAVAGGKAKEFLTTHGCAPF